MQQNQNHNYIRCVANRNKIKIYQTLLDLLMKSKQTQTLLIANLRCSQKHLAVFKLKIKQANNKFKRLNNSLNS